jgi:site-specific DNA recombinase
MTMKKTDEKDAPPLRRCAIYTRKSAEEGLDMEFNSLDAQREAGENYILSQKAKGWTCLPDRYDDGGFSGGNVNRPALERLLADCEKGLVDVIVVYKIDRLSRSICDFADLMKKFDRWNVSFCSVTQDINTATSSGRMMLNILVTFAQYEREIIGERIRDKLEATRKKGLWTGGVVAMGYRLEDHRLIPVPAEAEVVRRIFRRYVEVQSVKQVARELNEDGVKTRLGSVWNKPRVYRILNNPTYIGKISSGGKLYDGVHEGIVGQELWDKAHEFLEANTREVQDKTVRSTDVSPLKGLLRCGHCGGPMMPYTRTKKGKVYTYYRCVNDAKRAVPSCPVREIGAPVVEKMVFSQVSRAFASPGVLAALSAATGVPGHDILASFDDGFWDEATRPEARRIMELLLAGATLYADRLELEVNVDGIEKLEQEIEDGQFNQN